MRKQEWISVVILAMVTAVALLIGVGQIYVTGIDGDRLWEPESMGLLMETAVLFAVFFLIFRRARTLRSRLGGLALVTAVFTWLHQAFLPLLAAGAYCALILRVGMAVRHLGAAAGRRRKRTVSGMDRLWDGCGLVEFHEITAMADFVLGSGCLILIYCLMSLAGIGSIVHIRIFAVLLAALFLIPRLAGLWTASRMRAEKPQPAAAERKPMAWSAAILLSVMLALLLMQAGRMNICLDYDSLHYGLRSEYILNNENGIYENLGSIHVVYTYPKGMEILLLPLSGLPSYGFVLAFQVWAALGLLVSAGKTAELFVGRRCGLLCAALLSCIPGIMNMAVSAKTDMVTVLCQIIMVCFLMMYLKKRRSSFLILAADAFILSMVMKPTALVFSTVLMGTAVGYMFFTGQLRIKWKGSLWYTLIPMTAMWGFVWLRTLRLTGIPVTSVFYSIWEKLGFYVKYPFWFAEIPSNGGDLFTRSGAVHMLKRLYGVLLAPVGEDMAHVRIAWGTSFMLIFSVLLLTPALVKTRKLKNREKQPLRCLVWMFVTTGAASLAALYLLWQVDGNYFMLLYCLMTILAVVVIGKFENSTFAHLTVEMLVPVAVFNITVMAVSNWAGTLGLTPVRVVHGGYYDHRAENERILKEGGNRQIWEILAADGRTRVLVFGEQPEMLLFPCNAQSYTDIEGSDGNRYIAASPEALVCYLNYAETEYIYLESGYLRPGSDGWDNVTAMLEKGYMTEILYENGHALGRFDPEPEPPGDPEGVLREFSLKYWAGEQQ